MGLFLRRAPGDAVGDEESWRTSGEEGTQMGFTTRGTAAGAGVAATWEEAASLARGGPSVGSPALSSSVGGC